MRRDWLASLAADIVRIKDRGTDVIVVSSGSIALGRAALALGGGALSLDEAQAAAAVGQIRLARAWEEHPRDACGASGAWRGADCQRKRYNRHR